MVSAGQMWINGNAVLHAYKPQIDELMTKWPHTTIKASGTAVGLAER
jgi:2,3-bisphosphoglycerate-independent phosphoglycerate mutase